MNKFAIAVLSASMVTFSFSALAIDSNAESNAAADAGMEAPATHQKMLPNSSGDDPQSLGSKGRSGNGTATPLTDRETECEATGPCMNNTRPAGQPSEPQSDTQSDVNGE